VVVISSCWDYLQDEPFLEIDAKIIFASFKLHNGNRIPIIKPTMDIAHYCPPVLKIHMQRINPFIPDAIHYAIVLSHLQVIHSFSTRLSGVHAAALGPRSSGAIMRETR